MVAGFTEDLSSEDETQPPAKPASVGTKKPATATMSSRDIELSSSDDSDDDMGSAHNNRNAPVIAQAQSDLDSDDVVDTKVVAKSMTDNIKTKTSDMFSSQTANGASQTKTSSGPYALESSITTTIDTHATPVISTNADHQSTTQNLSDNKDMGDNTISHTFETPTPNSHSAEEDSETESANQAVVMCDLEDISEDEMKSVPVEDEDRNTLADEVCFRCQFNAFFGLVDLTWW